MVHWGPAVPRYLDCLCSDPIEHANNSVSAVAQLNTWREDTEAVILHQQDIHWFKKVLLTNERLEIGLKLFIRDLSRTFFIKNGLKTAVVRVFLYYVCERSRWARCPDSRWGYIRQMLLAYWIKLVVDIYTHNTNPEPEAERLAACLIFWILSVKKSEVRLKMWS